MTCIFFSFFMLSLNNSFAAPNAPPPDKSQSAKFDVFSIYYDLPFLPLGGGSFNSAKDDLVKKIEKQHDTIAKDSRLVSRADNVFVLKNPDDDSQNYLVIAFDTQGKLLSVVRDEEKDTQCTGWKIAKNVVSAKCAGGEGGQIWSFDVTYDLKKMVGTITNKVLKGDQ